MDKRFTDAQVYFMLEEMHRRGWNDHANCEPDAWETNTEYDCMVHIHELFAIAEQVEFDTPYAD